jgi:dTDP-glucose 4,6-dehydratase
MDNLLTGSLDNIEHLFGRKEFLFMNQDVTEFIHIPGRLDAILHFASPASPIDYLELPIQTLKVGSLGTHKVLGLAKAKGARFLLASTSECYGDPLVHPQTEDYWGNVNPVGPRMRLNDGRALPAFMGQALEGRPITVFGDGTQTRSFCYVDDLVEGIWRLLNSDEVLPTNIGNPAEMTILDFAQKVVELTGAKSEIIFKDLPADDPKMRQPDISKAKRVLDWGPTIDLDTGLRRTLEYFRGKVAEQQTTSAAGAAQNG